METKPQIWHIALAFAIVAAIYLLLGMAFSAIGKELSKEQSWTDFARDGGPASLVLEVPPLCYYIAATAGDHREVAMLAIKRECPKDKK